MGAWVVLNGDSGVVTGFVPAKMWVIPGFYSWKVWMGYARASFREGFKT